MVAAAFRASYSDWKLIKTRSVVQIVFEVPLEAADEAYQVLDGMPDFGSEQWFAIAKLQPEAKEQEPAQVSNPPGRARKSWDELPITSQIAIRCNEVRFQKFLQEEFSEVWRLSYYGEPDEERAAETVRFKCKVGSRKDIKPGTEALEIWGRLEEDYQAWQTV